VLPINNSAESYDELALGYPRPSALRFSRLGSSNRHHETASNGSWAVIIGRITERIISFPYVDAALGIFGLDVRPAASRLCFSGFLNRKLNVSDFECFSQRRNNPFYLPSSVAKDPPDISSNSHRVVATFFKKMVLQGY
jgi:hypothetical protein